MLLTFSTATRPARPSLYKAMSVCAQMDTPDPHERPYEHRSTGESMGEKCLSPLERDEVKRRISFEDATPREFIEVFTTPKGRPPPMAAAGLLEGTGAERRSRLEEARDCLQKAKLNLGNSRNLKTNIKNAVLEALERLFELVEEAEMDRNRAPAAPIPDPVPASAAECGPQPSPIEILAGQTELLNTLKEHISELKDNSEKLEKLRDSLAGRETVERTTYASVASGSKSHTGAQALGRTTLHSVVVSSTDEMDTGDQVLERVRAAVDAKDGWVRIERVRKAKDRKIIMGCATEEERSKVRERLRAAGGNLVVEDVKNRDPLLVLKEVLVVHSDDELLKALRNQNREIFCGLGDGEDRMAVRYKKKCRNPHVNSVVLSVSPMIWRRALEGGKLRIDLQRVRVEDQTPLVQCTRCLAFGHGKRLCSEPADLCSHCGGSHLKADCPERRDGTVAVCVNCTRAKLGATEHNAFSSECPIRRKWDAFARAAIAYC